MEYLLKQYLGPWARLYLKRTGLRVIAITGSVGKTTTKEAIRAGLSESGLAVRIIAGNFNTSFSVATGILGGGWDQEYYVSGGGWWYWLRVCVAAPFRALFASSEAAYVIAEYGADRPGDIQWLTRNFPPHVSVVTAVGTVPVHVEYYASAEHVAQEKSSILSRLDASGYAILNADDETVARMRERVVSGRVLTFGMTEGADIRITNEVFSGDNDHVSGVTITLGVDGQSRTASVRGALGHSQAMACACAFAVGRALGVSDERIVRGLESYRPPAGRMRLIRGIKHTSIVDDTYNASPAAVHNALDALAVLPAQRRIAVIGGMLELGGATIKAHEAVGNRAADVADVVIGVGERARFIIDAAGNQLPRDAVFWYRTTSEAGLKVQELMREGDVILVKGSQGMRMERIVKEIMADPGHAPRLLVRQGARWLAKA